MGGGGEEEKEGETKGRIKPSLGTSKQRGEEELGALPGGNPPPGSPAPPDVQSRPAAPGRARRSTALDPAPRRCRPGKLAARKYPAGQGHLTCQLSLLGGRRGGREEAEKKKKKTEKNNKNNNNKATPVSEIAPLDQVTMEIISRRQKKQPEATLILSATARDRGAGAATSPGRRLRAPHRRAPAAGPGPSPAPRRQRCCPPPHSWNLKGPCAPRAAAPAAGAGWVCRERKSFPRGPGAEGLK